MSWIDEAHEDLRQLGTWRFWTDWRASPPALRQAAYRHGRFTESARKRLDRFVILQAPRGAAWLGAFLATRLVPRWLPGAGALPRTPFIGAVCLRPLPLILGVDRALTPEVIAHEFAHAIWPHIPRSRHRDFPRALADLEARTPGLSGWLDHVLAEYKDRRSPDECHVRLLEYFDYGRRPLPEQLWPLYEGWVMRPASGDGAEPPPEPA